MDLFAYIGETLRRLRKERDKTLDEVGQEAGLGRGQLSRIENGRQEATLSTLSKVLLSQGVSRREFFQRYELVEAEAEALERSGGVASADGRDNWPEEVRQALKGVEAFITASFLQPRLGQGTIELGEVVILFRVISKKELREKETPAEPLSEPAPKPRSRASSKRPARRRNTR